MNHRRSNTSTPEGARHREDGSALIIALMALMVLTLAGLALTNITRTEVLVGSQERTSQRVFYSADAGISVATARAIRYQHYRPTTYMVRDVREQLGGTGAFDRDEVLRVVDSVDVSPLIPVLVTACDGCEINEGLEWVRANHYVSSEATRTGTPEGMSDDNAVPLARSSVVTQIEAQPIKPPKYQVGFADRTSGTFKFPGAN